MNGGVVELVGQPGAVEILSGGVPGPPGPSGGEAAAHMHVQATASALWIINHNFGYRPGVTLLTSGGAEMDASIIHASDNQVLVTFTTPQTGSARCL